jgi:hypothetical protein
MTTRPRRSFATDEARHASAEHCGQARKGDRRGGQCRLATLPRRSRRPQPEDTIAQHSRLPID